MKLTLILALVAVASVVGYASYNKERPGGWTTIDKTHTAWVKDQARLPREGCMLGAREFLCSEGK